MKADDVDTGRHVIHRLAIPVAMFLLALLLTDTRGPFHALSLAGDERRELKELERTPALGVRRASPEFTPLLGNRIVIGGLWTVLTGLLCLCVANIRASRQALRESDIRTRQILDGLFGFVGLYELDGTLIDANEAPLKFAGLRREDVLGQPFWDTYWWNYDAAVQQKLKAALAQAAQGTVVRYETRVRVLRGEFITIDVTFRPLRNAAGEITHILGFAVDITERKRAEEALRRTEQRYRALFEQSPFGILVVDPATVRFVEFNDAACRHLGYTPEEFRNMGIADIEAVETPDETSARVWQILTQGQVEFETQHRTKDGQKRNVVVTANVIELDGKKYIQSIFQDITERKCTERALHDCDERFRQVVNSIPVGVGVVDSQGQIVMVNNCWSEQFGYPPQELLGQTIEILVPKRFQASHPAARAAYQSDPRPRPMGQGRDLFARRKDGSEFPVEIALQPFQFADDAMTLAVVTDITARKQYEQALSESRERYELAIRGSNNGIWDCNIASNEHFFSERYCEMLGYDRAVLEREAHAWMDLVHPDDRDRIADRLRRHLEQHQPYDVELRMRTQAGEYRWFHVRGQALWNFHGQATRMAGSMSDITERKALETQMVLLRDQLAHAARIATMGEMAAGIAHELNQPLGAISLYAEGLLAAVDAGVFSLPEARRQFTEIAQLAIRCGDVVRRLKQFATKKQHARSSTDLREVVPAVVSFLGHELRASATRCSVTLPDQPLRAMVESLEIQQVLINLVRNAIEAQSGAPPESRLVNLAVERAGDERVKISVTDRGPGIPPEQAERLFEPFFTTKASGLGMGLRICQTIVRAYGGDIEYSPGLNQGTTFTVFLPADKGLS